MGKVTIVQDLDRAAIREAYTAAITRLEQIETADPQTITQAQVIAAIQDIARFLRLLLKFIYKRFVA